MAWVLSLMALVVVACGGQGGEVAAPTPDRRAAPAADLGPLSGERILADAVALCAPELAGRGSYQEGGVKAAGFVARALEATGARIVKQDVGGGAINVLGIKRGRSGKAVVVSAHYDHLGRGPTGKVFLGADDNASGTAVLMAIARELADEQFEHTIVFASFGAEEVGLVGSGVYIQNPAVPIRDTVAIINFDMVGRNFFEAGADTPDTAAIVGIDEIPGVPAVGRAAAAEQGLTLLEAPPRLLELFRLENRTDDWWFRRVGVPAIHFSTGLHDDYHQVTDTPDKLVASQLEKIAVVATAIVRHVAQPVAATSAAPSEPSLPRLGASSRSRL